MGSSGSKIDLQSLIDIQKAQKKFLEKKFIGKIVIKIT